MQPSTRNPESGLVESADSSTGGSSRSGLSRRDQVVGSLIGFLVVTGLFAVCVLIVWLASSTGLNNGHGP